MFQYEKREFHVKDAIAGSYWALRYYSIEYGIIKFK